MNAITSLPERGVLAIEGGDRVAFLQGLVSNDVEVAAPGRAVWAALLTPQGKWLADFFIFSIRTAAAGLRTGADPGTGAAPDPLPPAHEGDLAPRSRPAPSASPGPVGRMPPGSRRPTRGCRIRLAPARVRPVAETATPEDWDLYRLAPDCRTDRRIWIRIGRAAGGRVRRTAAACRGRRAATWARS